MRIEYFDLLSPDPIWLDGVGYIKCPTLRDISRLKYKYKQYTGYLHTIQTISQLDMDKYLETTGNEHIRQLYEIDKSISVFNLLIIDEKVREVLQDAFSFFICGDVYFYVENEDQFFVITQKNDKNEDEIIGMINASNYSVVCDYILQMNFMQRNVLDDQIYGSEKARKIAERINQLKQKNQKFEDKDMNLGNLVSSLASRQNGLNIDNVWNTTIFQLYDQFHKQTYTNIFDIRATNYAFMGGDFDPIEWYKDVRNIN